MKMNDSTLHRSQQFHQGLSYDFLNKPLSSCPISVVVLRRRMTHHKGEALISLSGDLNLKESIT